MKIKWRYLKGKNLIVKCIILFVFSISIHQRASLSTRLHGLHDQAAEDHEEDDSNAEEDKEDQLGVRDTDVYRSQKTLFPISNKETWTIYCFS